MVAALRLKYRAADLRRMVNMGLVPLTFQQW